MNNHYPYTATPLVIPTSNSRPSSPVATTSAMAYGDHAQHQQQRGKRLGDDVEWDPSKRLRMDEPFPRRPPAGGNTAETEDIMAGIRGAFTPTSNPHAYPSQGFIPPVGFGNRGRTQTLSQTPVRETPARDNAGSGEDEGESEGSEEDDLRDGTAGGGRGKEEEERKRPKMTRGSR